MTTHHIELTRESVIGSFTAEIKPILSIESGDTIRFKTLDAGWGNGGSYKERTRPFTRRADIDNGHALIGPIYIPSAKKGMTLEVEIKHLKTGSYGWTSAGQYPNWQNQMLHLTEFKEITLDWKLDHTANQGICDINGRSFTVTLNPFLGVLGMPPEETGIHSTSPPRFCGGNIDCKELIVGSKLYLPISIDGAYFSVGDGHATQGDGEVCGQAIECPMEEAELTLTVRDDIELTKPRAYTPAGWITFGFAEDLNEATVQALDGMLTLLGELYGLNRVEAMALGSSVIDLRITQIVNGVKGVHALLPHDALK
ncbi:acetamidase/formamidase family protein [Bacillus horti]|uniref:Acetamidase/formamidase n=1 Tax=Caldalkalibacillus horti TaxID=77523 RepID=A0ABT9W2G3_9BACI|nr:acetamidase/formamidase family protein [Bacillus horti]MDQ0167438.1 acetamidase/formamidase [Bacillus horti]